MSESKIEITKTRNLSSEFHCPVVEFSTQSNTDFNDSISKYIYFGAQSFVKNNLEEFLVNEDKDDPAKKFYNLDQQEWWLGLSQYTRFKIKAKHNFLLEKLPEVQKLRVLINQCLTEYLEINKKDYHGHRPEKLHAWPVLCLGKRGLEEPHIHHFNPLNIACVYYAGGEFSSGNGELEVFNNPLDPSQPLRYIPKTGNILFFPATVPHRVGVYNGNSPRYSIGVDLWF